MAKPRVYARKVPPWFLGPYKLIVSEALVHIQRSVLYTFLAVTANSSSRPAAGHPLHGSSAAAKMKAPASAAGPSRAAVAVRLRRLLPWVLLLAAGTSMVFQALEQPPVEAGLPSQEQQQQQRPGRGVEALVRSLRHSLFQNETGERPAPAQ